MQIFIGLMLTILGALTIFVPISFLSKISYPIVWWGVILLIDYVNFRRWGKSLMRSHWREFFGIVLPFSVLYWLYFEFVNFIFPQWHYVGIIEGTFFRIIFTILTFGTVIPIIIEILWFFSGSVLSLPKIKFNKRYSVIFIVLGLIFAVIPFLSGNFFLNQIIWLAPFFIFLPFVGKFDFSKIGFIAVSGLIGGFLWEFLNFWSEAKWKYLILPDVFHIFEMPVYGYLGFIPFAFSSVVAYLFALRLLKPRLSIIIPFYISAFVASYLFVIFALNS